MHASLPAIAAVVPFVITCSCTSFLSPDAVDSLITSESSRPRLNELSLSLSIVRDGTVSLEGVRGETVAIAVYSQESTVLDLDVPDAGISTTCYEIEETVVGTPSTAMYGSSRGKGAYPDILRVRKPPIEGTAMLCDLAINAYSQPGVRTGRVVIGSKATLVELEVLPWSIDIAEKPLVWAYYDPGVLGSSVADTAYQQLFRRHGVVLATELAGNDWHRNIENLRGLDYWPVYVRRDSVEHFVEDAAMWAKRFEALDAVPFSIPVDEPKNLWSRMQVAMFGDALDRAGITPRDFVLAVTDAPSASYGDFVDLYISPHGFGSDSSTGSSGALLWTYNGRPPRAGSMVVDAPGPALRTWGWIAYQYRVPVWYSWEALYFADRYHGRAELDPRLDAANFRDGSEVGNGDGLLAYRQAQPSLRLKTLRRGLQDLALLRLLEGCAGHGRAREISSRVIPRALAEGVGAAAWPRTDLGFEVARREILWAIKDEC